MDRTESLERALRAVDALLGMIHDRHYGNQDCDEDPTGHRSPNPDMQTVGDCDIASELIARVLK